MMLAEEIPQGRSSVLGQGADTPPTAVPALGMGAGRDRRAKDAHGGGHEHGENLCMGWGVCKRPPRQGRESGGHQQYLWPHMLG